MFAIWPVDQIVALCLGGLSLPRPLTIAMIWAIMGFYRMCRDLCLTEKCTGSSSDLSKRKTCYIGG